MLERIASSESDLLNERGLGRGWVESTRSSFFSVRTCVGAERGLDVASGAGETATGAGVWGRGVWGFEVEEFISCRV